jgi:hypothetical protein
VTFPQLAIPTVWSAFTLWTMHRLWRPPKDPARKKYVLAAKFYCLFLTVFSVTILPSILIFPDLPYWLEGIVFGLIAFPVSLWAGYAVVRVFHAHDEK